MRRRSRNRQSLRQFGEEPKIDEAKERKQKEPKDECFPFLPVVERVYWEIEHDSLRGRQRLGRDSESLAVRPVLAREGAAAIERLSKRVWEVFLPHNLLLRVHWDP